MNFIAFAETQMKPLDSASIIDGTQKDFDMNFNDKDNKFLSLVYRCQDGITVIKKSDINDLSIICLRKDNITDRCFFKLMLVY